MDYLRYLAREIPVFSTVVISFWGVSEVLEAIAGSSIELTDFAVPAVATALVVAAYKAYQKHRSYVPDALASESRGSRIIYWQRRPGWQFALARQMLIERITASDRVIDRISAGAQYVPPRYLDNTQYLVWLRERPEILLRLIKSVALQCTSDFPRALAAVKGESRLQEIKDAISDLAVLYRETSDFALECRAVLPPDAAGEIHELVYRWPDPIRRGMHELLEVLASLANFDYESLKNGARPDLSFSIKFEAPESIPEFCRRLESDDLREALTEL